MIARTHDPQAAALVRKARQHQGLNQKEFGQEFGVSQSTIAKYESGLIPVPGDVLIPCMTKLGMAGTDPPSAAELAERVRVLLEAPENAELRRAVGALVNSIAAGRKRDPSKSESR